MNSHSSASPTATHANPASHALTWRDALWLGVVVVIGVNLRPLLTSISPLMTTIRDATGLSFYGASLLTSLPVVAMGIGAFGAGALTRLIGETRGVALGLLAIALACGARWATASGAALLLTAALAGVGVAAIQALLPAVMKQRFHARVPLAMGVFSASIMGGGGLGARLSPWVSNAMGSWHAGLAVWAIPALIALICWLGLNLQPSTGTAAQPVPASPAPLPLWRKRRAWTLGLYFGIVNGGYTTLVAWLPAFYQQRGVSVADSGSLLASMTVFQAAAALLLPLAAASFRDRRPWLVLGLSAQFIGLLGLILWPDAAPLVWVGIAGAGLGGTFSLTLVTAMDHSADHRVAGRLVAFTQGVGFVVAAIAPMFAGALRSMSGSFSTTWAMLLTGVTMMILVSFLFSPRSYESWR
ncbi:cyanate transporter [Paraburkholderia domus]|uniref:Transporter YycB n=1 Tax=Paraburkholderia domus TaxID=2793075 RepID=A0A9N8N196_9BURK|nr:cyanate transporter [Paraburkholderia domus]MBK5048162.1 cyanate transporter [Burkholderia sp. R-70006]MBK5060391.1 cyanate transporter [Burkholderia sp. R-70199]MBK5122549.1 cyanate transporter [Burkholderia sp. R-69980]MBK5168886.1 cyanate transporter [Burkholderia sp. R-70211]MBK5182548.1 cyanate transporter [Burkholderia sp. R-69749]MCI0150414.1 cyanate transporter [Paraburkholderia sediminicola]